MTKIFPNEVSQNTSTEFDIEGVGVVVKAKGMKEGQKFIFEYYFGDECEGTWEPVNFCCGQFEFCYPENIILFPAIPGKYRIVAIEQDVSGVIPELILNFEPNNWEDVEVQISKMKNMIPLDKFTRDCC